MGYLRVKSHSAPYWRNPHGLVDRDKRHGGYYRQCFGWFFRLFLSSNSLYYCEQITDFPAFWEQEITSYFTAVVRRVSCA
jgi:hypothetical protein